MRILTVAVAAAALSACASSPAPAPTPAAAAPPAMGANESVRAQQVAARQDPNKKVCRREQQIGSNYPVRICHTQAEWDAMEKANIADSEEFRRQMRSMPNTVQGQ